MCECERMSRPKGSQNGVRKNDKPVSQQEITDYLKGLNQVVASTAVSFDTERMKAISIANYLKWFALRGIHVYQEKGRYLVLFRK